MLEAYARAMDALHNACVFAASAALAVITLIIPWGVFTRYVLESASSWPEPLAVLLMIWLSFLSAVVCYRERLHIAVEMLPNALAPRARKVLGFAVELCMLSANLFLLWFGTNLVQVTWHQSIAEFPAFSVGMSYLPVPIGGALTALFVIERLLKGDLLPPPAELDPHATISSE